jgi:hypothetical protein
MSWKRGALLLLVALLLVGGLPVGGAMLDHAPCPDCLLPVGLMLCFALVAAFALWPTSFSSHLNRIRRVSQRMIIIGAPEKPPRSA